MARYKEATAADVREWANSTRWRDSGGNTVGDRGRFSSELITAFNDAHKRNLLRYSGGTPQGQVTQPRRTAQVATRTQSRSDNSPAPRRAPRATTRTTPARDVPAPMPVEPRVIHSENEAFDMVRDVMAQLTSAQAVSGEPAILMHVEGWSLATAS